MATATTPAKDSPARDRSPSLGLSSFRTSTDADRLHIVRIEGKGPGEDADADDTLTRAGVYLGPDSTIAYQAAVKTDLAFLHAWEDGQFPELSHYLRIRQIRKGNPILIAERLLRGKDVQTTRASLSSQQTGPALQPPE